MSTAKTACRDWWSNIKALPRAEILGEVISPSGKIWEKLGDFWEKWDLVILATLKKELHCRSNTSRSVISWTPVYCHLAVDPKFSTYKNLKLKNMCFCFIYLKQTTKSNVFQYWFFELILMLSHWHAVNCDKQSISINQYQCVNKCRRLSFDRPFQDHSEILKENYYKVSVPHTHFPATIFS